jgi:CRISPR-associated protein Csb1
VLIDSVQAQSNRAEQALKSAIEGRRISLPLIEVDFGGVNDRFRTPIENLTSLDVPHRLADAILRDSELPDGTRFSKSEFAKRWARSNIWDATAVYELCPTALVFGMWGSPEKPGGLGAKFERAYVSEIVAVDVDDIEKRSGFRVDPLGIKSEIQVVPGEGGGFRVASNTAKGAVKPSEINHGNIIYPKSNSILRGGVRASYIEQSTVVSLGALRKLRFPVKSKESPEMNTAGRAVLGALGLCAGVLASEMGTSLRSRCQLVPESEREWELIDRPGAKPRTFKLGGDEAIQLLNNAIQSAKSAGLGWMEEKLVLRPTKELADLVYQSQEAAAKEKGEGEAK